MANHEPHEGASGSWLGSVCFVSGCWLHGEFSLDACTMGTSTHTFLTNVLLTEAIKGNTG